MRWFQWVKTGHEGAPPRPIPRPGVKPPEGSHRRGNATRSETNKVLGMRLTAEEDPDRQAKLRRIFRGTFTGPIRDITKTGEVK